MPCSTLQDWLTIRPKLPLTPAKIECYADHRIAMSFAVLGTAAAGVTITDPKCVAKTYPHFFADLDKIRVVGPTIANEPAPKKAKASPKRSSPLYQTH